MSATSGNNRKDRGRSKRRLDSLIEDMVIVGMTSKDTQDSKTKSWNAVLVLAMVILHRVREACRRKRSNYYLRPQLWNDYYSLWYEILQPSQRICLDVASSASASGSVSDASTWSPFERTIKNIYPFYGRCCNIGLGCK